MSGVTLQFRTLLVCAVFCVQIQGGLALADDVPAASAPPTEEQAMQRVREELETTERRWYVIGRLRYTYPQQVSAGIGAMIVNQPKNADCSVTCVIQGWQFEIEPGLYGTQGSVGWGKLVGATGRTKRLMHTPYLGWAVRGVVMRTYRGFRYTPLPKTLAGIEGSFTFARLNFSAAILHSLSSDTGDDWLISSGVGFGF